MYEFLYNWNIGNISTPSIRHATIIDIVYINPLIPLSFFRIQTGMCAEPMLTEFNVHATLYKCLYSSDAV